MRNPSKRLIFWLWSNLVLVHLSELGAAVAWRVLC
jgi:hypothetical protein